jgi:hypothetical protein
MSALGVDVASAFQRVAEKVVTSDVAIITPVDGLQKTIAFPR